MERHLTQDLPAAVRKFTPEGRLPTEDEAARLIYLCRRRSPVAAPGADSTDVVQTSIPQAD